MSSAPWSSRPRSAHPRTDGFLSRLKSGADLLLRAIQHIARLLLDGLELFHGPVTNVPRLVVEVIPQIVAPIPHRQCPDDCADQEPHDLDPPARDVSNVHLRSTDARGVPRPSSLTLPDKCWRRVERELPR